MAKFRLSPKFVEKYQKMKPPFGFNGLGELTYYRTYSRIKDDGTNEEWWETIERVVNGTYNMQKDWIDKHELGWNPWQAQNSAQEMYDRIFHMKFMPPGRGLWAMGTTLTEERGVFASLNNCAYVSSETLKEDPTRPFTFLMDTSMLGLGTGFDVKGAGKIVVKGSRNGNEITYVIPDTREGWVESLKLLLESYFLGTNKVEFDYSKIRKAGEPIKGFGGISSGPEALREMHINITNILEEGVGVPITITTIVDIMNLIGKCVVAGNVRRSASLVIGPSDSEEYLDLKDYDKNPGRASHGWSSNNSIDAKLGMDYSDVVERTIKNGEPGYIWLENAQKYGRMMDPPSYKDKKAQGVNPCFSGDTLIAVADGRSAVSIKELAESGEDFPVYSMNKDTGDYEIKWARHPRKTRTNTEMLRVVLDDDSHLDVTPDHKFITMNGVVKEAKDLLPNDSLPRYTRRVEKMKDNSKYYYRIRTSSSSAKTEKFEHRLIAKFFDGKKWDELYDEEKVSGWVKGGLIIHHKDYNALNNSPDNLEIMTFKDHSTLHGKVDNVGEKNPMHGKTHSEDTKKLIGAKTAERCQDPEYRKKLSMSHTDAERLATAKRMSEEQRKRLRDYYIEQAKNTDLDTVWKDYRLYVRKKCEVCGEEMILEWRKRANCYCSITCSNKSPENIASRTVGLQSAFKARQKTTLHNQIRIYKDIESKLNRTPSKKEWEKECKSQKVSFRPQRDSKNEYMIKGFRDLQARAVEYNHRVKRIDTISNTDAYNLTVEDHHTVGVITSISSDKRNASGIFCSQCSEQTLFDKEICNLVETFPDKHANIEDYKKTLKYAYLYAKTVTLGKTHWPETNRVMLKNRRIGCSMSGIAQFITNRGIHELKEWMKAGYDKIQEYDEQYSDWFAVPRSIKTTSIKPSGTVSLLAGATPGMHYPESRFYIRRVRLSKYSSLVEPVKKAGYTVVPAAEDKENTVVIEIPVDVGAGIRTTKQLSIWEQMSLAALLQKYWADNQVSCTITFDPKTEGDQIKNSLDYFQYQLKGVSFLPRIKKGAYEQMPYEKIDEKTYKKMLKAIKKVNFKKIKKEVAEPERFCDGESCKIEGK